MRYVLFASTLLASPALAQTTIAPFASRSCPGLTYHLDGTRGWNYGGTNDLSTGNGQFASNQASEPTEAVTAAGPGISVGVTQTANGLQGAMVNTHGQFAQQYGYFEMAAELTEGALQPGMTTAFWLMSELGGWPPEIDIQETSGSTGDTAVHSHNGTTGVSYQYDMKPGSHVWATHWTKDTITFYIDAKQVAQTTTPPDFHVPMYMILDAMSQGGVGTMHVQYIRVFRDMESAIACVPKATGPSNVQLLSSLSGQVRKASQQTDQLQATIPVVPVERSLPQLPPAVSGYNPQFVQYGQQAQQQLQSIQDQIADLQLQLDNFKLPELPASDQ
jgi:glycosyl hydrolase family 16